VTDRPVRVRFAPSPTGYFHVGSARTALFNAIFARQHGGTFVLRIEDTDAERNRPEWTDGILAAMRWIGADWDEGPVFQSARVDRHREAAEQLHQSGHAYYCDCTRPDIDARTKGNAQPGYDGFCRDRGLGPGEGRALRFRTPREGSTTVVDLIRGEPTFENRTIEDFVLLRANGTPMFILANVVDDMDMGITHVIRGEEHLPNTPKALLVWDALGGGPQPVWAHVPVLVNEKRQKLSKRRDKVALEDYRNEGYLAGAMRNYLMLLGWSPRGDEEIVPWSVIEEQFRLEDVVPSPAFFDVKKLTAVNAEHIRRLPVDAFVEASRPWLTDLSPAAFEQFVAIAPLVQERVKVLSEVPAYVDFFDAVPDLPDEFAKATKEEWAATVLDEVIRGFEAAEWKADDLQEVYLDVADRLGVKRNKAQAPVRVAVTGRTVGPPLFESLQLLGREETLVRLRAARARL
jgi:glutamyl-tRNA synthetase